MHVERLVCAVVNSWFLSSSPQARSAKRSSQKRYLLAPLPSFDLMYPTTRACKTLLDISVILEGSGFIPNQVE